MHVNENVVLRVEGALFVIYVRAENRGVIVNSGELSTEVVIEEIVALFDAVLWSDDFIELTS